jgi:hypothetical protein
VLFAGHALERDVPVLAEAYDLSDVAEEGRGGEERRDDQYPVSHQEQIMTGLPPSRQIPVVSQLESSALASSLVPANRTTRIRE